MHVSNCNLGLQSQTSIAPTILVFTSWLKTNPDFNRYPWHYMVNERYLTFESTNPNVYPLLGGRKDSWWSESIDLNKLRTSKTNPLWRANPCASYFWVKIDQSINFSYIILRALIRHYEMSVNYFVELKVFFVPPKYLKSLTFSCRKNIRKGVGRIRTNITINPSSQYVH